jgi:hypothetical protein
MKGWIFILAGVIFASVISAAQQPSSDRSGSTPTPKSDASVPHRVRISREVAQRLLIKTVPPKYPLRMSGAPASKGWSS